MKASVLVATPHAPFGDLLRTSLEDSGQYSVRLAHTGKEARDTAGQGGFQLAVLDAALKDEPFVLLCHDLLAALPDLRLIVVPPNNDPNHPDLGGLMPHGYLSRPFYLPDLIQTAARLIDERESAMRRAGTPAVPATADSATAAPATADSATAVPATADSATAVPATAVPAADGSLPPWLQNPVTLTAYLEKELAGTQALAGVIGLAGVQQGIGTLETSSMLESTHQMPSSAPVLTSAGAFNPEAAEELASVVFRYWDRGDKADLMRFIRLSADKRDYLVYATRISGEMVLILAFDTAAPLSQIRPRTRDVARTLASHPPDGERGVLSAQPLSPAGIQPAAPLPDEPAPPPSGPSGHATAGVNTRSLWPEMDDEAVGEDAMFDLAAMLGDIPPPDPERGPARPNDAKSAAPAGDRGGAREATAADIFTRLYEGALPDELLAPAEARQEDAARQENAARQNLEAVPAKREGDTQPISILKNRRSAPLASSAPPSGEKTLHPQTRPLNDDDLTGATRQSRASASPIEEPPIDPLEDTRPGTFTIRQPLDPFSPALSLLNYTCVLMPRVPQHFLTGALADQLAQWVAQTCAAYGWRLEGIALRPEYLLWSVQVPPTVSPGNLVRVLRQRTSGSIFATFTDLAITNSTGDFWAPGYLIVSGPQPPSAQLLRDYVSKTRGRLGR